MKITDINIFTGEGVQEARIVVLAKTIDALYETNGALQTALDNAADTIAGLQRVVSELNAENVQLKQQLTRYEVVVSGGYTGRME